ncbi:MAG: FAD-binding oxidoreductase [bacterium]
MSTYDAIVIGAGSVGLPSAYYLAERGLKVLVLEALSAPGQGQHKAAIGGVRATHSDPAKILLCKDSLDIFRGWQEAHGFSVGWKPGGYAFPVYSEPVETTLRGLLPTQKSYGLSIDWIDADAMAELIPGLRRDGLRGGTYSPDDGQVSPLLAAEAFRRAAVARGAEFRYHAPVTGIRVVGGRVQGVDTPGGSDDAPLVLNASGANAREVGALTGLDIPVTPDSHEAGISAPLEHFLKPLVVDLRPGAEGKTANFYFGQNHEGQIIFCYTPRELFLGTDRESTSEFLPVVTRRLIELVPRLRNMLIRRVWRGLYPMTPDGVAIIDRAPEPEGLFLAVGMCGQGFMLGPGVGRAMASLIIDGELPLATDAATMLRFDRDFHAGKTEALK